MLAAAVTAVVLAGAVPACRSEGASSDASGPPKASSSTPAPRRGPLTWRSCESGLQCARLRVPLDYADPAGPTISLALIRIRARHADQRIGSLVVNPGGPGASGVQFLADARSYLPDGIADRFDVVGFDPRGIGRSAPVECGLDLDAYFDLNPAPRTTAERAALVAASQTVAGGCATNAGTILPHVSTKDGARDLDRIRQALGDRRLTYLGYSYGTLLGAWYAELFPTNVRALVLDGAVDPKQDFAAVSLDQSKGFQRVFDAYLAGCDDRSSCGFPAAMHATTARAAYDALWTRVQDQPIPAKGRDGRALTAGLFQIGLVEPLYLGEEGFRDLDRALTAAAKGNGTRMIDLADAYTDRGPGGRYDNSSDAYWAVTCLDLPAPTTDAAFAALADSVAKAAPDFGAANVNLGMPCAFWSTPPVITPGPLTAPGAPPIVVIGGTQDPATPYANARSLAAQLESGVLVTVVTNAHTAYPSYDDCLDPVVNRYLLTGKAPRAGLRCD